MSTRHLSGFFFEVVTADWASWEFKLPKFLIQLTVSFCYLDFWQVLDRFLGSWGSAWSAPVLHREPHDLLKQIVTKRGPELHVEGICKEEERITCLKVERRVLIDKKDGFLSKLLSSGLGIQRRRCWRDLRPYKFLNDQLYPRRFGDNSSD